MSNDKLILGVVVVVMTAVTVTAVTSMVLKYKQNRAAIEANKHINSQKN